MEADADEDAVALVEARLGEREVAVRAVVLDGEELAGVANEQLGRNARSGALLVFFGKRRSAVKVLFFDGSVRIADGGRLAAGGLARGPQPHLGDRPSRQQASVDNQPRLAFGPATLRLPSPPARIERCCR